MMDERDGDADSHKNSHLLLALRAPSKTDRFLLSRDYLLAIIICNFCLDLCFRSHYLKNIKSKYIF